MNLHLQTTGFKMTPAIRNYLDKKLKNIKKLLSYTKGKNETWIELAKTTKHHHKGNYFVAQIDIALKNRTIHAEERGEGLYEAMDKMEARIIRELKHYRDKKTSKDRRMARVWKTLLHISPLARKDMKGKRNKDEGM